MGFLVIALINIALVVGGGEVFDKTKDHLVKTEKKLQKVYEEVNKKTTFNIDIKPVINFNPNIKVSPTIKSKNDNTNTNVNDNLSSLDFGDEGGLKKK